jgi:hypothetical protein
MAVTKKRSTYINGINFVGKFQILGICYFVVING